MGRLGWGQRGEPLPLRYRRVGRVLALVRERDEKQTAVPESEDDVTMTPPSVETTMTSRVSVQPPRRRRTHG